jgi:4-alpha-glucanotransferase
MEWENLVNADYRYYMALRNKNLKWGKAVRFDELIDIVKSCRFQLIGKEEPQL